MADMGTATAEERQETGDTPASRRRIQQGRRLPGGRAVVGALLVTAAAVGVFAAFLMATAEPETRYLVATQDVPAGTRLTAEVIESSFTAVPLELPPGSLARRAVSDRQQPQLVGYVTLAPIARDDLLLASAVADDGGVAEAEKLSFAVPASRALAGRLTPGERIDVVATYSEAGGGYTAFVVRGALLLDVSEDAGALGGSDVVVTVALTSLGDVQAVLHAVNTATVSLTRSSVTEGAPDSAPGPYRPSSDGGAPPDTAADGDGEEDG